MELNFCGIDFETACNNKASALAIGLVRVRNSIIVETFYSLIKPPKDMEIIPFFTSIHGITMKDVEKASTFQDLKGIIYDFIGDDYLVAHNASFDRSVLIASLDNYGLDTKVPEFECTLEWSRRAWAFLADHRLDTVSNYLNIDLKHHEALSDAIACSKIFVEAKNKIG